jgi:hypothetical protein
MVRGRQHVEHGGGRIQPDHDPQGAVPQQAAAGHGHPQGPGDVQRRQRGELIGALGLHRAGKCRDRPRDDVVVTGQHPGWRDRIEPERHEADRGDGEQCVAVQREMRRAPPDQDNADHAGDGALEQDVVPAGGQGGDLVRSEPAVHDLRERAAELTADRVDRDRVPQSGQRRVRAETGCVIEAPQQGRYRDDLQVAKGRVPDAGGVAGRDQVPGLHQRGGTRPRAAARPRPARRGRAWLCCAGTGSCSGCAVCRKPHPRHLAGRCRARSALADATPVPARTQLAGTTYPEVSLRITLRRPRSAAPPRSRGPPPDAP